MPAHIRLPIEYFVTRKIISERFRGLRCIKYSGDTGLSTGEKSSSRSGNDSVDDEKSLVRAGGGVAPLSKSCCGTSV